MLERGYIICALPRSGSNFLCALLRSTEVLGNPREYFHLDTQVYAGTDYPYDPVARVQLMKKAAATANGVYGVKVLPAQFEQAAPTRFIRDLPNLSFIYLRRNDLIAQAISFVRAIQTGQWKSQHAVENEPAYNPVAINNRLAVLVKNEARWRYYFARNGLKPLHMIYEEVAADPQGAVSAVAGLVGLAPAPQLVTDMVELDVQRDALSEEWRDRFVAEVGDLSVFHS